MFDSLRSLFGWADVIDVLFVAFVLWAGIAWVRRSRARLTLIGVAIAGAIYVLANALGLQLTVWILQGFFAAFVIFIVVVFQEDLRRFFEQLALWGLRRRSEIPSSTAIDKIVRAVDHMASARVGALIVLPGREPLERHVEGGVGLDGRLSEPLLLSIFDSSSPGHDGAVVVVRDRIPSFAVHLPLSTDHAKIGRGGTRHAAALGLAERCDALCVVVSEERGTISVARDGQLRRLSGAQALTEELQDFIRRTAPTPVAVPTWKRWRSRVPEVAGAVAIAVALWGLLVPGGSIVEVERNAPVKIEKLPSGYVLESVDPPEVTVILSGPRRALMLGTMDELAVHVDALLAELGRRTFRISPDQVGGREGLGVVAVTPDQVRISLRRATDVGTGSPEVPALSPPADG